MATGRGSSITVTAFNCETRLCKETNCPRCWPKLLQDAAAKDIKRGRGAWLPSPNSNLSKLQGVAPPPKPLRGITFFLGCARAHKAEQSRSHMENCFILIRYGGAWVA